MCCLEHDDLSRLKTFQAAAPVQSATTQQAIQAWNLMGGALDWAAVTYVSEYLQVQDMEILIDNLRIIREHAERKRG